MAIMLDTSTTDTEEEPAAPPDGVMFRDGYIFNEDDIFARKADSLIKYSAEVMKACNTSECRNYTYCFRVDHDQICLNIGLFNSTYFEELEKPEALKLHAPVTNGYIFDRDETFFKKAYSLLRYSLDVMEECTTKECRSYTYCTNVGDDIVCLTIRLNTSTTDTEEEPAAPPDGVMFRDGYIFNEDDIFARKADSLIKYSAEVMKACNTSECRNYTYCFRVDHDQICLNIGLFNSTYFEELEKPEALKLHAPVTNGYIFDRDETFFKKADSLLRYSLDVMEECTTKECRSYTYCTNVGDDIVCLTIRLSKNSDLLQELEEEDPHEAENSVALDVGYIFDDDETFAEKSEDLLHYSASVMSTCTTSSCRHYTFCTRVGSDILCLNIWLTSIDDLQPEEELDTFDDDDNDDEPNNDQELDDEDILDSEQKDNNELTEEKYTEEESEKESKESEEEEEKQSDDSAEEKVEDTPLA
ncbi:uncharacterized protein LOC130281717 isoform X2 [Hyla sarda]|uniref:uncharacterized protein LOC130281717 isoform X2 n=1 Tax=Hyla sarda TaxID=327740 RepID=UPI0024C2B18D|nr:uncharacterized protein LOC130281717 isoform X2 [Hyla sarda]